MKEYSTNVTFYLANYDNVLNTGLKTDTITIYGSSAEPTYSYTDRASHQASVVTENWIGGVFTLTVQHNGPLDINVGLFRHGNRPFDLLHTSRHHAALTSLLTYTGPLQYEAECFDYKSVASVVTSGWTLPVRNYKGQGHLQFGTSPRRGRKGYGHSSKGRCLPA